MDVDAANILPNDDKCVVCNQTGVVGIYSSGIAPVSGNLCADCLTRRAENLGVVHLWVFLNGGTKTVPEFSLQITSFHNGEYIAWPRIKKLYIEMEPEIRADFFTDVDLEDVP